MGHYLRTGDRLFERKGGERIAKTGVDSGAHGKHGIEGHDFGVYAVGDELLLDLRQFDDSAHQSEEMDYFILTDHFAKHLDDSQVVLP